jgi:AraC family transcriptional regulator
MRCANEPLDFRARAVERVIAAMRAPEPEVNSLHDMADMACLSPFHFSRVFRDVAGIPPAAFFGALRLDRAKRLLLQTDQSVTEVCFALGYASLGSFTTRFSNHVGVSPGRFRRLPEATAAAFAGLQDEDVRPRVWPGASPAIRGTVIGPAEADGPTFIGLFPIAMAQGKPVAGTVIARPGPFSLPLPPDGRYSLLAVNLPPACDPAMALAPDASALVGSAVTPIVVCRDVVHGSTEITLRPFLPIDPPVLIALPPLLFASVAASGES